MELKDRVTIPAGNNRKAWREPRIVPYGIEDITAGAEFDGMDTDIFS